MFNKVFYLYFYESNDLSKDLMKEQFTTKRKLKKFIKSKKLKRYIACKQVNFKNWSIFISIISSVSLDDEDYLENMGIVGTLVSGEQIIVILPNALVTSAFEVETKNKEQATYSIVAECHASFEQEDLEHLPYEIYYPQTPTV